MILKTKLILTLFVLVSFLNRGVKTTSVDEEETAELEFTENDDIITILKINFSYKIQNYKRVSVKVYHEKPRKAESERITDVKCDKSIVESPYENNLSDTESLKLTPFIKENKIAEARNACRVDPNLFLCVESYSGYFTVNETYDSNIFFWYFPVEIKPLETTPLIIWLQGGPGASSMEGLFSEIGPFTFTDPYTLQKNPNTWLRNHSLLFIDSPVGTGFSYTKDENGYATDMQTYTDHLYEAVRQFMRVFPEVREAPLFVAGESYAGKYVPALAARIHEHKSDDRNHFWGYMNLQGIIVGNAFIDPEMIPKITEINYYLGLLDYQQKRIMQPFLDEFQDDVEANRSVAAKEKWEIIWRKLTSLTNRTNMYNFLRDEAPLRHYLKPLRRPKYTTALHVGDDIVFNVTNAKVYQMLAPDFLSSAKHLYEELLNETTYRVLTYCGNLDMMMPCVAMTEQSHSWIWTSREEFHNATRNTYVYDGNLAGYHKTGGGLTEVVFRGAGHMAPAEQPGPVAELVARWTQGP